MLLRHVAHDGALPRATWAMQQVSTAPRDTPCSEPLLGLEPQRDLAQRLGQADGDGVIGEGRSIIGVIAISALATANATTQTGGYVQADVQSIATLANALKTQVNAILAALKVTP